MRAAKEARTRGLCACDHPKAPAEQSTLLSSLAEGIRTSALVLGPECEVIAFDGGGNLVYPQRKEPEHD